MSHFEDVAAEVEAIARRRISDGDHGVLEHDRLMELLRWAARGSATQSLLTHGMSGEEIAHWWTTPNAGLKGAAPLEELRRDRWRDVLRAVEGLTQVSEERAQEARRGQRQFGELSPVERARAHRLIDDDILQGAADVEFGTPESD